MLSIFKFHIALALLNEVDRGKLNLDEKILVKKSDLMENTWSPLQKKFPEGNFEMSISELLEYMICYSDNNTTDLILRILGGPAAVQKFADSKKVQNFRIVNNEKKMHEGALFLYDNYTTTHSLSTLLKRFWEKKIVSKKSTKLLLELMYKTTTGANKLSQPLPKGSIAHRTGSSGKTDHLTIAENDAGIVTLSNGKHYAISVFINDSTESDEINCQMISNISKLVYQDLNTN